MAGLHPCLRAQLRVTQPQPFGEPVGPGPQQGLAPHRDARHPAQAGAQGVGLGVEGGLDFENIAAFHRIGHRRDPGHLDGQRIPRQRRQRQAARLPDADPPDVPLVHLDDHAEAFPRRHGEQHVAPLDRAAQGLAEVTADHHAIEGRLDAGAPELLVHQRQLGPRLVGPGLADHQLAAVGAGHGGGVGVFMLG